MWTLKGNERNQEELDNYPKPMFFSKASTIKTISLASVMWRMIIKREDTYYRTGKGGNQEHQCTGTRSRSVEDIYSVAKNCVKGITREKVEIAIEKLIKADLIVQSYCGTIQRRVHCPKKLDAKLQDFKTALK